MSVQKVVGGPNPTDVREAQARRVLEVQSAKPEVLLGMTNEDGIVRAVQGEFPIKPYGYNAYDQTYATKLNYAKATNNWVVPFTERDAAYVESKQAEEAALTKDRYIASQFDLTRQSERNRLDEMYPEYFNRRMELVKAKAAIQLKYAQLRLRGCKTKEDLDFAHAVSSGAIMVSGDPLWYPDAKVAGADRNTRGYFSVLSALAPYDGPTYENADPYEDNANYGRGDHLFPFRPASAPTIRDR